MVIRRNPIYSLFMLVLSIYVLIIVFLDTFFITNQQVKLVLQHIDFAICLVFLFDFFFCLYIAENKWRYLKWGWIDLVSSIPMVEPLRWARISRIIRIIRFLRTLKSIKVIVESLYNSKIRSFSLIVLLVTFLTYSICSSLILEYEQGTGSSIKTASDALWWGFLNIMNAKINIQHAQSEVGMVFTVILNKVGLLLFAYFNAVIIAWLVSQRVALKNGK